MSENHNSLLMQLIPVQMDVYYTSICTGISCTLCNVKVKDRVPVKELRERLGIDYIILILQQNRLRWCGHVMRKEDTDWV